MKYLLFIRHGEAQRQPRLYDHEEKVYLSEKGRKMVQEVSNEIELFCPDLIVSSTIPRCIETSEILTAQLEQSTWIKDYRLRERAFPSLFDKSFEEIESGYGPEVLKTLLKNCEKLELPGEESMPDSQKRVVMATQEYLKSSSDRIAIISHGGPHSWLICHHLGISLDQLRKFRLFEAHFSVFEFTDSAQLNRIVSLNTNALPKGLTHSFTHEG